MYTHSETDSISDTDDAFGLQLGEIGDRINAENDRVGFLRMVNRNHVFNSSNYSLSSLFRFDHRTVLIFLPASSVSRL